MYKKKVVKCCTILMQGLCKTRNDFHMEKTAK